MHIFDTKKEEDWIELLHNFFKETSMATAVFDTKNNLLIKSGKRNNLCLHIKNHSQSQASICSLAQSNIALIAEKQRSPIIDFCDANCIKAVVPCFMGNTYLGGITACGCKVPDEPLNLEYIAGLTETSVKQLRDLEVDLTDLKKLKPIVRKYHALINVCEI